MGERTEEFKKHEEITQNFLSNLEKEEPKGASSEKGKESSSSPEAEKEKTEGKVKETESVAEKAEAKAKEDEIILNTPDEELEGEKKERKEELLKKKGEKDPQDKLDKRFGELTGEIKDLKRDKSSDKDKISELETELAAIKAKLEPSKEDKLVAAKEAEKAKYLKYLKEDEGKPREDRREMSNDELEEWLLEDNIAAEEWLAERSLRRVEERREAKVTKTKEKAVKELTDKMHSSARRAEIIHPELKTADREEALTKEGKTDKEIHDILCRENPKYKMMFEIIKANPQKYCVENGPELAAEEMTKRLGTKKKGKQSFTEDELDQIKSDAGAEAIETEKARIASLDEGVASSKGKVVKTSKLSGEMEGKLAEILKRSGITREDFDRSAERRVSIGA